MATPRRDGAKAPGPYEGGRVPKVIPGPWSGLYPFTPRYLERPRGLTSYLDEGEGPPLIMVHGNPTWSFLFRDLIPPLAGKLRCLAPDHLGMGLSARLPEGAAPLRLAERILEFGAFIDFLESPLSEKEAPPRRALSKGEKIHLLVHDWGGPIALGWAVKNPSRVGSIVFTNTGFRVPPGYKLPWELFLFRKMGPLASLLSGPLGLFTRGLTKLATVRPLSEAAREGFLAPYRIAAHRGAIQAFVDDIPLDKRHPSYFTLKEIHEGLASLKDVPARLIWGLKDFVFDASFFQDLRASFPRAGTLALPRAGHFLFEDEPLKIQRELLNFYASLKLF